MASTIRFELKGKYLHIKQLFSDQTRVLKKNKIINVEFESRRFYWSMPFTMTIVYAKRWVEDTSFYIHKVGYIPSLTHHEEMRFKYKLRFRHNAVMLNRQLRDMDIHTTFNIVKKKD